MFWLFSFFVMYDASIHGFCLCLARSLWLASCVCDSLCYLIVCESVRCSCLCFCCGCVLLYVVCVVRFIVLSVLVVPRLSGCVLPRLLLLDFPLD